MSYLTYFINIFLHIDVYLGQIIANYGTIVYFIMFTVIFVETGLVFVPFLPGDSLIFAAGAFAALGSLNIFVLWVLLCIAAVLGDTVNYWIGHFFGAKIISHPKVPIDQKHIEETEKFFDKYGGKTIIIARFVPFIRTFAPFVAGIGKMSYKKFLSFNLIGGVLWVSVASFAGFFFGNIPFVKKEFSLIVLAIVLISVIPTLVPVFKKIRSKRLKVA